jgi:hypothetical protein
MEDKLETKASEYYEVQEKIESKQKELKELKTGTFGTDSENAEQRAREFFSNAGKNTKNSRGEEIDKVRGELDELDERLMGIRENLLERLADLQLPFEEVIEPGEKSIEFPFQEPLGDEVIAAMEDVLNADLRNGEVSFTNGALVVETSDVEEAIEMAEDYIESLRAKAGTKVDVGEYVDKLRGRDEKVALTLYILNQGEPLTKKKIESRMGVEPGTLRGQVYYVLENDPYLKKQGKEFWLTETGREVIEAYVEEYGEPEGIERTQEVSR